MSAEIALLAPNDVAAALKVDVGTLRNWRTQGRGPKFVKLGRQLVRYRPGDVAEWVRGMAAEQAAR